MLEHWTVVGHYPGHDESYVEHVTVEGKPDLEQNMKEIVAAAIAVDSAREEAEVVAVFRGHLDDEYYGLGMASGVLTT